jgi:hypothetical protein
MRELWSLSPAVKMWFQHYVLRAAKVSNESCKKSAGDLITRLNSSGRFRNRLSKKMCVGGRKGTTSQPPRELLR